MSTRGVYESPRPHAWPLMAGRRLVSTRRRVPKAAAARYEEAWDRAGRAVRAQGAHAWQFAGEEDERLFIEFIEFGAGADPRQDAAVRAALDELENISEGIVEGWIDAEDLTGGDRR